MNSNLFKEVEDKYFSGDFDAAFLLCKNCADAGNVKCIRFMGWFYYTGDGTTENLDEALKWFNNAADLEDAEAFFGVGAVHYKRENYEQALVEFNHSAELGYVPAKLRLGLMYKSGLGTLEDINRAYELYSLAAKQGNLAARGLLVRMLFEGHKGWYGRVRAIPMFCKTMIQSFVVVFKDKHDHRLSW